MYNVHVHVLTQHDFVGGDYDVEFVRFRDDLASRIAEEEVILVDEATAVGTAQYRGKVEIT